MKKLCLSTVSVFLFLIQLHVLPKKQKILLSSQQMDFAGRKFLAEWILQLRLIVITTKETAIIFLKNIGQILDDDECLDVFTHYEAMEYLKTRKPKVLYVAYGETDDWAHAGHYKDYLEVAHHFDKWLKDIWNYIQKQPQYKDKTSLFITVDHGRGTGNEWTSHGSKIDGSNQIWFAVMGPDTPPKGEVKAQSQFFQKQFAPTIASLLGLKFTAEHPVAEGISTIKK